MLWHTLTCRSAGQSGEPSWSMLYRLRNGALAGRDAGVRVVVLATGTNDIGFEMGRSLHEPQQHAQEIVQRWAYSPDTDPK